MGVIRSTRRSQGEAKQTKTRNKMTILVDNLARQELPGQGNMTDEQMKSRISKMEKLDSMDQEVVELMLRIQKETETISEKEFLILQDKLEKFHLGLDGVETMGDDEVRKKRKAVAALVTATLKLLDIKANKISDEQIENEETVDEIGPENGPLTPSIEEIDQIKHNENPIIIDKPLTTDQIEDKDKNISTEEEDETKKNIDDKIHEISPGRVKMSVSEHKVVAMIDLSDLSTKDLKVNVENNELLVSGDGWSIRRGLPSNCLTERTMAQLSCDGALFVNIPRRKNLYQRRNFPFRFNEEKFDYGTNFPFWF